MLTGEVARLREGRRRRAAGLLPRPQGSLRRPLPNQDCRRRCLRESGPRPVGHAQGQDRCEVLDVSGARCARALEAACNVLIQTAKPGVLSFIVSTRPLAF